MLLSFIMPHDDHFHPCCLGIPADIPCAFIEIVPEKVFPLPAQYIELFAVFNGLRTVLPFGERGDQGGPFLVEPLVGGLNGTAAYHKRDSPEIVCHGQEIPHTRIQPQDPLRGFRRLLFFYLVIKGDQDTVVSIYRLDLRLYILHPLIQGSASNAYPFLQVYKPEPVLSVLLLQFCRLGGEPCGAFRFF